MPDDRLGTLLRAARRLAQRWPRPLVLRATGEPVRLLRLDPDPSREACLVETDGGEIRLVRPEDLASRSGLLPEAALLQLALVLAASVATLALLGTR